MRLIEFDGKQLFRKYDIPVPKGTLWPKTPGKVNRYVVKPQLAQGGRGKLGGIHFADTIEDVDKAADILIKKGLAGKKVEHVYIEEYLDITKELYLAVTLDRDAGALTILVSANGGINIESTSPEDLLRLPIDPLVGYSAEIGKKMCSKLSINGSLAVELESIIASLYKLSIEEDAILAEINPLVITSDNNLVAADSKIELDPNADFRHPYRSEFYASEKFTDFEDKIAKTGSVAVEIDSKADIVAIVSGAGVMMAILDLLVSQSVPVRAMVDLGGTANIKSEDMEIILDATKKLNPKIVLITGYLQTAQCGQLAQAIVGGLERVPLKARVLVRLKGRGDEIAKQILSENGIKVEQDLGATIHRTVEIANQSSGEE